jgi:hypothetical protein
MACSPRRHDWNRCVDQRLGQLLVDAQCEQSSLIARTATSSPVAPRSALLPGVTLPMSDGSGGFKIPCLDEVRLKFVEQLESPPRVAAGDQRIDLIRACNPHQPGLDELVGQLPADFGPQFGAQLIAQGELRGFLFCLPLARLPSAIALHTRGLPAFS